MSSSRQPNGHTAIDRTRQGALFLSLLQRTKIRKKTVTLCLTISFSLRRKILRLRKEIKRIKGGQTYPTGYERDRAREIKSADALRLAGKPIPTYLEGLEPPWIGMGKAHRCFDDNEISKREAKIENIKRLNAEHCQQEHIANMPSIVRKGGPGGQVQG